MTYSDYSDDSEWITGALRSTTFARRVTVLLVSATLFYETRVEYNTNEKCSPPVWKSMGEEFIELSIERARTGRVSFCAFVSAYSKYTHVHTAARAKFLEWNLPGTRRLASVSIHGGYSKTFHRETFLWIHHERISCGKFLKFHRNPAS